jgi:hypothetical protein
MTAFGGIAKGTKQIGETHFQFKLRIQLLFSVMTKLYL